MNDAFNFFTSYKIFLIQSRVNTSKLHYVIVCDDVYKVHCNKGIYLDIATVQQWPFKVLKINIQEQSKQGFDLLNAWFLFVHVKNVFLKNKVGSLVHMDRLKKTK